MDGYLATGQATQEATAILEAAGLTGKRVKVSSRVGMQPVGVRELVETEVTVRPADYETAFLALLREYSQAHAYAADERRSMRFYRLSGRIVGEAGDGGRPSRPSPEDSAQPAAGPIMPGANAEARDA